jgi:hypothetical protein
MFAGLTIIPRLIHFKLLISHGRPFFYVNLSHHPPSLQNSHEFGFRTHSICSGCFGSLLSILFAEFLFLVYFIFTGLFLDFFAWNYLLVGLILISVSYSRYIVILSPKIRLIQHLSLFTGIAFSLVAADLLFKSAFSMILLLPSWLLFLFGRVQLGNLDHFGA